MEYSKYHAHWLFINARGSLSPCYAHPSLLQVRRHYPYLHAGTHPPKNGDIPLDINKMSLLQSA